MLIAEGRGRRKMDRDETDGYRVEREFLGRLSAEELLERIIRAHREMPDQEEETEDGEC